MIFAYAISCLLMYQRISRCNEDTFAKDSLEFIIVTMLAFTLLHTGIYTIARINELFCHHRARIDYTIQYTRCRMVQIQGCFFKWNK